MATVTVNKIPVNVTIRPSNGDNVVIQASKVTTVKVGVPGLQGPPGPPGTGGSSSIIESVAGENLSALRVVYQDPETGKVFYADRDDLTTLRSVLGVTITSGLEDENLNVMTQGLLDDDDWAWNLSADPGVFLDANGLIIQGPPATSAATLRVGFVMSETSIFVKIGATIQRA